MYLAPPVKQESSDTKIEEEYIDIREIDEILNQMAVMIQKVHLFQKFVISIYEVM